MGKAGKKNLEGAKSKTLFIRNLPFTLTNEQLTDAFKEFGPINGSYIVNDNGTKTSRGIGYVRFTERADAEKALKGVKKIEGRVIKIALADPKKVVFKGKEKKREEKPLSSVRAGQKVMIKNLPFSASEDTVRSTISEIEGVGSDVITKIDIPKDQGGKGKGFALVTLSDKEPGEKIISSLNNQKISGRNVSVSWFLSSSDYNKSQKTTPTGTAAGGVKSEKVTVKTEPGVPVTDRKNTSKNTKHRVIIRNLPFKVDQDGLKKELKTYGEVTAVDIPLKDGKKRGFAFVSLSTHEAAQRIVSELKTVSERQVAVDFAIDKDKYQLNTATKSTTISDTQLKSDVKPEPALKTDDKKNFKTSKLTSSPTKSKQKVDSAGEIDSDDEDESSMDDSDNDLESKGDESESDNESQSEESDDDASQSEEIGSEEDEEDSDDEGFDEDDNKAKKKPVKNHKTSSADISQERTLFLRNVGYETTEEDLTTLFSEFGEVSYVKLVVDHMTERSKGIGFVQYKKKSSAEAVLEAKYDPQQKNKFFLGGRDLNIALAISREKVTEIHKSSEKQPKDKRNLYLAREGLIRDGTQAADGVSKQDMNKRNKLVMQMKAKLKNPLVFISPTRLCIHNLPPKVSDGALKAICFKSTAQGKAAKIIECRIMRDLDRPDEKGVCKSRGYAFVNFTEHEHALACLRELNNNPKIFSNDKRPIVEFSLENTKALQAREKRQQANKSILTGNTKGNPAKTKPSTKIAVTGTSTQIERPAGVKPGLPSHSGPKIRHKPRPGAAVDPKKEARQAKKRKEKEINRREKESNQQPKPKQKKVDETDKFDKLVDKYRSNMSGVTAQAKSKWYQ